MNTEPKVVLSVVVGSQLHGLANDKSDTDIRGVFMHPLIDFISPFKTLKNTSWIEGDIDNTSYELCEFAKYATKGNMTILEIMWSNMVRESDPIIGRAIQENRSKFLDSEGIFNAAKGYAHNQYNKMNLFQPDARTPKFVIAYIRVLQQAIELLTDGTFSPQIIRNKDLLLEIKYKWSDEMIPVVSKLFAALQVELADVHARHHDAFTPDIPWIEAFLFQAYYDSVNA